MTLVEAETSRPRLGAPALGVLLLADGSILVVESGDEGVVEGGAVGGSGHEGHEGGLAGIVGGGVTGGQGASVLLEAVVLLIELLEHLEDDAEVDVGVGDVDLIGGLSLAADADEGSGGDGADAGSDTSDDGGGSGPEDGSSGDGGGDEKGSNDGL